MSRQCLHAPATGMPFVERSCPCGDEGCGRGCECVDFDPDTEFPPVGAVARIGGERFTFGGADPVGWHSFVRFAYPFSVEGRMLARHWAEQGQGMAL